MGIKLHFVQNVEHDPREISFAFHGAGTEIGQKGAFCKGLTIDQWHSRSRVHGMPATADQRQGLPRVPLEP